MLIISMHRPSDSVAPSTNMGPKGMKLSKCEREGGIECIEALIKEKCGGAQNPTCFLFYNSKG